MLPPVPDRLQDPEGPGSENYWPDRSRTVHLDARNVQGLTLRNVRFGVLRPDERPSILAQGCTMPGASDAEGEIL